MQEGGCERNRDGGGVKASRKIDRDSEGRIYMELSGGVKMLSTVHSIYLPAKVGFLH